MPKIRKKRPIDDDQPIEITDSGGTRLRKQVEIACSLLNAGARQVFERGRIVTSLEIPGIGEIDPKGLPWIATFYEEMQLNRLFVYSEDNNTVNLFPLTDVYDDAAKGKHVAIGMGMTNVDLQIGATQASFRLRPKSTVKIHYKLYK